MRCQQEEELIEVVTFPKDMKRSQIQYIPIMQIPKLIRTLQEIGNLLQFSRQNGLSNEDLYTILHDIIYTDVRDGYLDISPQTTDEIEPIFNTYKFGYGRVMSKVCHLMNRKEPLAEILEKSRRLALEYVLRKEKPNFDVSILNAIRFLFEAVGRDV